MMALHDKPESMLNRLLKAHKAVIDTGKANFEVAQSRSAPSPNESFFADGYSAAKIRRVFFTHMRMGVEGQSSQFPKRFPNLWLLDMRLRALTDPEFKLTGTQLAIIRELEEIIMACAAIHPQIAEQLVAQNQVRDQMIQDRWGPKRVDPGPTPFEQFTKGRFKTAKEA